MARKSNKTAHVLNLLAGGQVDSEQSEHQEPELKKKSPSNISLIDPASISDPLSSLIRDSLDKEVIQSDNDNNTDNNTDEKDGSNTGEVVNKQEITETAPAPPLTNDPAENLDQQLSSLLHDETAENVAADNSDLQNIIVDESPTAPVIPDILAEKADDQTKNLVSDVISPEIEDKLTEVIQNQLDETPPAMEEPLPVAEKTVAAPSEAVNLEPAESLKKTEEPVSPPYTVEQVGDSELHVAAEAAKQEPAHTIVEDKGPKPEEAVMTTISEPPTPDMNEESPAADTTADNITPEEAQPELEYKYVNMMDIIVEERLLEFMNRFNVCTCKRCVADTKALALNNLPPKYIVAPVTSLSPLLSFNRNKYNIYVITELTKACLVVLDQPRH